jgi:hypothetical protein
MRVRQKCLKSAEHFQDVFQTFYSANNLNNVHTFEQIVKVEPKFEMSEDDEPPVEMLFNEFKFMSSEPIGECFSKQNQEKEYQRTPKNSELQKPRKMVSNDKDVVICPLCPKTFKYNLYLQHHYFLQHSGKQPTFECDICGKRKFNIKSMKKHMFYVHPP